MLVSDWHATTIRVRYQETDAMGVVYHGNYVVWFELARTDWTRSRGVPYAAMEARGLLLPVVDLAVQYKRPARYDDEVEVRCRVADFGPVRLAFEYEISLAGRPNDILVTGASRHVWVDKHFKPTRLDRAAPDVYEALHAAAARDGKGGR